jgi:hypothetical protein
MEIRYKNTFEDIIAFNEYHYANSDTFIKQRKKATIYVPIILFVLLTALFALTHKIEIAAFGVLFIALYVFFIHREYKRNIYKTIRRLYEEQDMKGFICEHILRINEEEIVEKTNVNERKDKWHGVSKIAIENDYAFIYVGAIQAHIVPRNNMIDGDFDSFFKEAGSYWQKAKSTKMGAMNA